MHPGLLWPPWVVGPKHQVLGAPLGPNGFAHAALAGVGRLQWTSKGAPIWCYLCWVPPLGHTRPKWWCVATRGLLVAAAPIVATKAGLAKDVGPGGPQWHPSEVPWWLCVWSLQLPKGGEASWGVLALMANRWRSFRLQCASKKTLETRPCAQTQRPARTTYSLYK